DGVSGFKALSKKSRWLDGAGLLGLISYLVLALTWFDHDLPFPLASVPPLLPLSLLIVSAAIWIGARGFPRPFSERKDNRLVLVLAVLSGVSRLPFLAGAYGLFSSDAAVQGVMALHILEGKHHPIFLYRWSYVGSLKAHLTALLAWVTGEPVVSFALAAILMYALFTGAVFVLARSGLPRHEALGAALYVILAPGFLTAWGSHNEGNYGDVLAFGTIMLALGARMLSDPDGRGRRAFWMGVAGGLAFWTHILATYYLLIGLIILVGADWSRRSLHRLALFGGGFVLGDFPGLLWNASHEWLSFRWWTLDQTAVAERFHRAATQLWEVTTTSLAVLAGWWPLDEPPWPGAVWRWVLLGLFPAALMAFVIRTRSSLRSPFRGPLTPEALLVGFAFLVTAVFAQSSFGWLTDEPRYLLFLFSVLPIFLASSLASLWRRARAAAVVAVAAVLFVNLNGSGVYLSRALASDGVNRRFVADVERLGLRYGHTDYHISYKYNFLSHGRLVWTSALGPSQTEWYLPYRDEVARAEGVALIPRSYRFARRICRRLDARGVTYRREDLLYPVIFDLSDKVKLESLR
ncbi:MAG: ArnT family glycosyltransferase, partial [Acidobacteriota bacterium]